MKIKNYNFFRLFSLKLSSTDYFKIIHQFYSKRGAKGRIETSKLRQMNGAEIMSNEGNLSKDLYKVKDLWGQKAKAEDMERRKEVSWMVHPYIEKHYINRKISGNPEENWLTYIKNKYIPHQLKMGLNLGCGDGCLERHAFHLGICKRFDAFDIAEGAIKVAKEEAAKQGIDRHVNYEVGDINNICLEENKYDIAFTTMSAHHFKKLEHIFFEVKKL